MGRLIGFVNGMVTDDRTISDVMFEQAELHKEDGKWQSVFGLDVLPEHRRKGYAGQLMRALIEHSREDGRCGCILTCKEHLLPYYTRFGFRNLGVSCRNMAGPSGMT
ncbi:MAG: GNAT family N-acetyltransferase [Bilophila wadsworthia]